MYPRPDETIIDAHFSEPAQSILAAIPQEVGGVPFPVEPPTLQGVLSSSDFAARLASLQQRADLVKVYMAYYNSLVARGRAPQTAGPLAAGWSVVQKLPGSATGSVAFPDQPSSWVNGEPRAMRQLPESGPALDTIVTSVKIDPSRFTPEVEAIGPYGPDGPDHFTPWQGGAGEGIPLELWSCDDQSVRTIYPTGAAGGLTLRIGDVTSRFLLSDPTFGDLAANGDAVEVVTRTPHGLASGDEIDLHARQISSLSIVGALQNGDYAYLEFYPYGSTTPYGGSAETGIFKVVAKTMPAVVHTETISGHAITTVEFAIGNDAIESARNAAAAIGAVSAICSIAIPVLSSHQIIFVPRDTTSSWFGTIGGNAWTLAHFNQALLASTKRMPYYCALWYDGTKMEGAQRAVVRLGHRLPVVVVNSTRIRIPGAEAWLPLTQVLVQRVRGAGEDAASVPNSLVRILNGAEVDLDSLSTNLIGAIKQCEAYQRYAADFTNGTGQFTFSSFRTGGILQTGISITHPRGVDISGDPTAFRIESLYWSVPENDTLDLAIPGALALRGDGPYSLRRDMNLRLLSAEVGACFECQLDLAETHTARAGLAILGDTEVGAELFVKSGPVYSFGTTWSPTTATAQQWMLRPYIRSCSRLESNSPVGQDSDQQVIYGAPVAIQQWSLGTSEPFASMTVTPSTIKIKVDVLPYGSRRIILLQVYRDGGPYLTLNAFIDGTASGSFGPVAKFCTPPLAGDGVSDNSQTQRVSFSALRVSAPTGRVSAPWSFDAAEAAELMPYGCIAASRAAASAPRRAVLDQALLPGQKLIGLDERYGALALSFNGFPVAGSWLELSTGGHRFYVTFASAPAAGAVLLPTGGTFTEKITRLVDALYTRLKGDPNLDGLLEVSFQSLSSWGSDAAILRLRALRPGPHYNVRARLLGSDRTTLVSQDALRLTLLDYDSAAIALPSSVSTEGTAVTACQPGAISVSTTFYEES